MVEENELKDNKIDILSREVLSLQKEIEKLQEYIRMSHRLPAVFDLQKRLYSLQEESEKIIGERKTQDDFDRLSHMLSSSLKRIDFLKEANEQMRADILQYQESAHMLASLLRGMNSLRPLDKILGAAGWGEKEFGLLFRTAGL